MKDDSIEILLGAMIFSGISGTFLLGSLWLIVLACTSMVSTELYSLILNFGHTYGGYICLSTSLVFPLCILYAEYRDRKNFVDDSSQNTITLPITKPAEKEIIHTPAFTDDLQKYLHQGNKNYCAIEEILTKSEFATSMTTVTQIQKDTKQIFSYLQKHPQYFSNGLSILVFTYQPRILKFLAYLAELETLGITSKEIQQQAEAIQTVFIRMEQIFTAKLHALIQQQSMDIAAELEVMKQMTEEELSYASLSEKIKGKSSAEKRRGG